MNRFLFGLALLATAAAGQAFSADSPKQSGADKLGWKLTLQSWTTNTSTRVRVDRRRQEARRALP